MTSKERVMTVLAGEVPDRVPLFELGINPHFIEALSDGDEYRAYESLGLDMMRIWPEMQLARYDETEEFVDVFGRVFRADPNPRTWGNFYVTGRLRSFEDIDRYSPAVDPEEFLPTEKYRCIIAQRPGIAFAFTFHGPLELTYESMGIEEFCLALYEKPDLVRELLRRRTDTFIELARHAVGLGAACVCLGDDAAFKGSSLMSPAHFEEFVSPCYRQIVRSLPVPVLWHSDGFVETLLPQVIEVGIVGVHALEPAAGVDLGRVKERFGEKLVLIGNVCCSTVLTQTNLEVVRADVDRCMRQAKEGGRYVLSSSNSLHGGIEVDVGLEMFRYGAEVGGY
jgi:uroporphyrinogen decarboxylase